MSPKDLQHIPPGLCAVQRHGKTHATLHDHNFARRYIEQSKFGGDAQCTKLWDDEKIPIGIGQTAV